MNIDFRGWLPDEVEEVKGLLLELVELHNLRGQIDQSLTFDNFTKENSPERLALRKIQRDIISKEKELYDLQMKVEERLSK